MGSIDAALGMYPKFQSSLAHKRFFAVSFLKCRSLDFAKITKRKKKEEKKNIIQPTSGKERAYVVVEKQQGIVAAFFEAQFVRYLV